jgi:uncharacterized protein (DUF1684 family)
MTMKDARHLIGVALVTALAAACGRSAAAWPDPPAVDASQYRKDHDAWLEENRQGLSQVLPIIGIWAINEGDTPFGSDTALPIALPAAHFPAHAGVVHRAGDEVTMVPSRDSWGPVQLIVTGAGDGRRFLMGMDESHPAVKNPPMIEAYPLDSRWRVAARFDAFEKPRPVRVSDVRGGEVQFMAAGTLTFRVDGKEMHLTAFGEPGTDSFFVMFKDPTNQSTTYQGYRIVSPKVVANKAWTVIDFNFAANPPCAYSKFTTCPLPPPENKVPVAVEAGLKRLAGATGYSG